MKIKIDSDVFDIIKRINEIDEGYFILFDLDKNKFELHNINQPNTYCLTYPYDNLDERMISLIYKTNSRYIDNIIEDIDKNNAVCEKERQDSAKCVADYMIREIYAFSNNSSKNLDDKKMFASVWR